MFFVLFFGTVILGQVVPQNFEVMEGLLTEINQCKQIREKFSELKTEFSDIEIQGIHKDMRLKILTSVNSRLRAELRRVIQTNDLLKDKLREMSLKLGETRQPTSGEYTQSYPTPPPPPYSHTPPPLSHDLVRLHNLIVFTRWSKETNSLIFN